ncbi:MAG: acyltransferase [Candidatus Acidiferrales bacterium]
MTNSTSRSIPSLDGLRTISVTLVILSHSLAYFRGEPKSFPFIQMTALGQSGVDIFFVISGFLITGLLLKDSDEGTGYRLKRFYLRRFFRIFPPFYLFLGVVWILWKTGFKPLDYRTFITAATYTYNYLSHGTGWLLAHTWSLSLEEQFYIVWAPCLVLLGKRKSTALAIGVILLSPAIRFLTYVLAPPLRGNESIMLHTRLDTIMFGCAMALLWRDERFNRWVEKLLHPSLVIFSMLYILIVAPCLSTRFAARYDWPIGYGLEGLLISIVLLYAVRRPSSGFGRFLNWRSMRHIGVISYGIYLWQQMFTGPNAFWVPLNIVLILACAELSYWLVERPSFRLRDWLEKRWIPRPALPIHNHTAAALADTESAG